MHACTECGSPLHEDQAACLSCGAMVDQGSGFAGIRRAALGSATALLVLGTAVGGAVAGLPHGKHVAKRPEARVFGPKEIPPATAEAPPGTGADGATDLPGADAGSKPPAIAPKTPRGSDSTSLPPAPGPSGSSGVGSSRGSPSGGSGGSDTNGDEAVKDKPKPGDKGDGDKDPKPTGPKLNPLGEQGAAASIFTSDGPSSASGADKTIDGEADTAWTTHSSGRGVMVTPRAGDWNAVGVVTETPGWSVTVYETDVASPESMDDWTFKTSTNAGRNDKLDVDDARHYLVFVTSTGGETVRINEIQLFQE
jgi:hypothetical protein